MIPLHFFQIAWRQCSGRACLELYREACSTDIRRVNSATTATTFFKLHGANVGTRHGVSLLQNLRNFGIFYWNCNNRITRSKEESATPLLNDYPPLPVIPKHLRRIHLFSFGRWHCKVPKCHCSYQIGKGMLTRS